MYNSLENAFAFLGFANDDEDDVDLTLYTNLHTFKLIYYLNFLTNRLHYLSKLSQIFQYKFVDVSSIVSVIRIEVTSL